MIAGPGSIASIMLLMARSEGLAASLIVLGALLLTLLLTLIALLLAGPLMRLMGRRWRRCSPACSASSSPRWPSSS